MEEKHSRRGYGTLVLIAILLPVFYVLSIGPAFYVLMLFQGTPLFAALLSIHKAVYAPLAWLYGKSEFVKEAVDWYGGFFGA